MRVADKLQIIPALARGDTQYPVAGGGKLLALCGKIRRILCEGCHRARRSLDHVFLARTALITSQRIAVRRVERQEFEALTLFVKTARRRGGKNGEIDRVLRRRDRMRGLPRARHHPLRSHRKGMLPQVPGDFP